MQQQTQPNNKMQLVQTIISDFSTTPKIINLLFTNMLHNKAAANIGIAASGAGR